MSYLIIALDFVAWSFMLWVAWSLLFDDDKPSDEFNQCEVWCRVLEHLANPN